jgi:hypothetical protein
MGCFVSVDRARERVMRSNSYKALQAWLAPPPVSPSLTRAAPPQKLNAPAAALEKCAAIFAEAIPDEDNKARSADAACVRCASDAALAPADVRQVSEAVRVEARSLRAVAVQGATAGA